MPKLDDVLPLISAIGQRDYRGAGRTVEVMIANERKNNREQAARSLERAYKGWPNQNLIELPRDVSPLVWSEEPKRELDSLYLNPDIKAEVDRFLSEREKAEQIREAGLPVTHKVLLAGPPGNGKTSLAEALAKSLRLTFLPVKLHTVIESYIGRSGKNLGKLFEYALFNNTLLFIDELDAMGSSRGIGGEASTKEYNIVVNALLMNLDRLPDTSVIIGATNLPVAIDPALERRFSLKLWLDNPTEFQIDRYLSDYQRAHNVQLRQESALLDGLPWSRIEEFCVKKHKNTILEGSGSDALDWVGRSENG